MNPERLDLQELLGQGQSSVLFHQMVARINQEALFVYPTETIYGIGGIATDRVRERVLRAKKREGVNPLILIAGNREVFAGYNVIFNRHAEELAEAFWPGKLTLILPVAHTHETVGIRVSDHPFIAQLAGHVDLPLYSTSANISDTPYTNDPDTIYDLFAACMDFMVDAGVLPDAAPSTVVDVSQSAGYAIVREGAMGADAIRKILDR